MIKRNSSRLKDLERRYYKDHKTIECVFLTMEEEAIWGDLDENQQNEIIQKHLDGRRADIIVLWKSIPRNPDGTPRSLANPMEYEQNNG